MTQNHCPECGHDTTPDQPLRVITVRLPESLHHSLIERAHKAQTSLNKFCVGALERTVEEIESWDDEVAAREESHQG